MAEELRELTVRLSLSADNFSRNIKSINQQIKQAEARFKEMGAGSKTFGTSVQGLTARLTMLRERLNMQRASVAQYEQALAKANTSLATARDKHADLEKQLAAERQRQEQLKTAVDQARKAHEDAVKTYGENSDEANALGVELLELESNYKDSGKAVKDLESKLTAQQRTMQNASDKAANWQTRLSEARAEVKNLEKQITNINPHLDAFTAKMDAWSANLGKTGKTMQSVGKALTGYITTPVMALGGFALKASIEFEDAFAGVRKTVDATEEEYKQLEQAVKDMSFEMPSDTSEISEVMATAGQLGIYTENLRDYSKTMIDLGESTDIVANEAAKTIAQFFNITGTGQDKVRNFGSALVDLGNNFATTESAIMNMASRLAGAGAQIGLTDAQILGFATGLTSVGIEAEAGGSAFSKVMTQMQVAVETNNAALADFARVSGMTSEQFVQAWKQGPADAIQAFIVGLSQMDEEGISAIVTLQEMGLTEIRLRDTLLRATNANQLFARAQETASRAWQENTALTEEAEKRYATTASRLEMLKNRATVAAQELGDELAPAFADTIDWAEDLIDKFMDLDTAQKEQIIKWAAIAAAAGPALIVLGKVTTGAGQLFGALGKVGKGLGTAAAAFKTAGGGAGGLVAALTSSKVATVALVAALGYGVYSLIDWASGAKAAREATEKMVAVAKEWKDTVAETFYDRSQGLAAFGIDTSAFAATTAETETWLNDLYAVWSDGKKETDEIVDQYAEGFASASGRVREALTTLSGETSSASLQEEMQADIDLLNEMDARVAELLKKRQNGMLSDADKVELESLISQREDIIIKYRLEEETGSGFEQIAVGVESAIARAKARNPFAETDISIYEDALKAGAEGMAAYNQQLNERYDAEYALISAMEDGAAKEKALAELNESYNADRIAAAQEYAALLQKTAPELFGGEEMQQAETQISNLRELLMEYSALQASGGDTTGVLGEIAALTEQMNEGQIASYITALTQLQDAANQAGVDVNELFPELNVTEMLGGYETIGDMLSAYAGEFPGLEEMFGGALAEEVMRVQAELDFGEETPTVDVTANVIGYIQAEGEPIAITGVNIEEQTGMVTAYTQQGDALPIEYFSVEAQTGTITGYTQEGQEIEISGVDLKGVTGNVVAYTQAGESLPIDKFKVDPETGEISGYSQTSGEIINFAAEPQTGEIVGYTQAGEKLSVTGFNTANLYGTIMGYIQAQNAVMPSPEVEAEVHPRLTAQAISNFRTNNSVDGLEGTVDYVRFSEDLTPEAIKAQLAAGNAIFTDADGLAVNVSIGEVEEIYPQTIFHGAEVDEDGNITYHYQIVPELGSREAVDMAEDKMDTNPLEGTLIAFMGQDTTAEIQSIQNVITEIDRLQEKIAEMKEAGQVWDDAGIGRAEYEAMETSNIAYLNEQIQALSESETDLQNIAELIATVTAAIQNGNMSEEEGANILAPITDMLAYLEKNGGEFGTAGMAISEGIGAGLTAFGWENAAGQTASDILTAINEACGIHSPAELTRPAGDNIAAGIGAGMREYGFSGDAGLVANNARAALSAALPSSALRPIGLNAMLGLASGIRAGQSSVVSAMRSAARAAVSAAKSALKIKSPSRVFRDEVGVMIMRGLGEGIESEMESQRRIIANAARYLTDVAGNGGTTGGGSSMTTNHDNRNQSSNIYIDTYNANSEEDVDILARKLGRLQRNIARGYGHA